MSLGTVSHLAFGVTDLDRSLTFYRDVLGMSVRDDRTHRTGASAMHTAGRGKSERRVANLSWDGSDTFLVLSQFPDTTGAAIKLDQVGIHHVALWVQDVRGLYERLSAAGVTFVAEPVEFDAKGYGLANGTVITCLLEDPDGIILQFDQHLQPGQLA